MFKRYLISTVFVFWLQLPLQWIAAQVLQPEPDVAALGPAVVDGGIDQQWGLANEQAGQGDWAAAEKTSKRLIAKMKSAYPGMRAERADAYSLLAEAQQMQEDYSSAAASFGESVALLTAEFGKENWQTVEAKWRQKDALIRRDLTPQHRQRLVDAERLAESQFDAFDAADFPEAIRIGERVVKIESEVLGEQHPLTAGSIDHLGLCHHENGDHKQASKLYRKAQAIRGELFGEKHPGYANSLNNLAGLAETSGRHQEAEGLFREVLEIYRATIGEEDYDYINAQDNLAGTLTSLSKYDEAQRLYMRAFENAERVLGPESPILGRLANNVGLFHNQRGNYEEALIWLERSARLAEQFEGPGHPDHATRLNNLAKVHEALGDFTKASGMYAEAIDVTSSVLGANHPQTNVAVSNMAGLKLKLGEYGEAAKLYRRVLASQADTIGRDHPNYAITLEGFAKLAEMQGDYAKASSVYRQAMEIRKGVYGERHEEYARSLNNLAGLLDRMGDGKQATALFRQSHQIVRELLGEQHPDYATSLSNLSSSAGTFKEAESLLREALGIQESLYGKQHPSYAGTLKMLGWLHLEIGEYDQAGLFFEEASEIEKLQLGEEHPVYLESLSARYTLAARRGDYDAAEATARQVLETSKRVLGMRHIESARIQSNLATLLYVQNEHAEAVPLFRDSLQTMRDALEATSASQSERQQLVMADALREQLDIFLSMVSLTGDFEQSAFEEVLAWKGATLIRQRQMRKVAGDKDVAPVFGKLQQVSSRLASLSRMFPDPKQQVVWRRQVTQLTSERERLEAELSQASSAFRQACEAIRFKDLQASLPASTALVDFLEYWRFLPEGMQDPQYMPDRCLVAFVIRPGKPVVMRDLGLAAPIGESIDEWRRTFGESASGKAAGSELRARIWQSLEALVQDAETVLVSVDGVLGRLPFAALPGRKAGTYLLEDYRLAMIPVPQLLPSLVENHQDDTQVGKLLVMGDVDYEAVPANLQTPLPSPEGNVDEPVVQPSASSLGPASAAGGLAMQTRGNAIGEHHFAALAATGKEISAIADVYRTRSRTDTVDITRLTGAEATEQAFREKAPGCTTLHLATHGFFSPPSAAEAERLLPPRANRLLGSNSDESWNVPPGLLSGLAFSGANREPVAGQDDGILTADEISSVGLDDVDLVVLSACETGLGEVAGGEGLLGVQRAFQVAGADTTVASLWQVGDVATQQLMDRFYRNYWAQGMTKLDALREAQLFLLNRPSVIQLDPADSGGAGETEENASAARGDRRFSPRKAVKMRLSPQFWAAFSISGDWR